MELIQVLARLRANRKDAEDRLAAGLRIPTVSSMPDFKDDVRRGAEFYRDDLEGLSFKVDLVTERLRDSHGVEYDGHPIVVAESPRRPGRKRVVFYGHYDVQPARVEDGWISDPFEPVFTDGHVIGRGVCDNKGPVHGFIEGLRGFMDLYGELPVDVVLILEGEEECGSGSVRKFLTDATLRERFGADVVLVTDTGMAGPNQPAITWGLRGIAYMEMTLTGKGQKQDIHSGHFGNAILNPGLAFCELIAGAFCSNSDRPMRAVEGFYTDVRDLTATEAELLASDPRTDESVRFESGSEELWLRGMSAASAIGAQPSFELHGIDFGFTGVGAKTIIPNRLKAKMSVRLVPDQNPQAVFEALKAHFERRCPSQLAVELEMHHAGEWFVTDVEAPLVQLAVVAEEETFGNKAVFMREGGSIPAVVSLQQSLGAPVVLVGRAQGDDGMHQPKEKYSLETFHLSAEATARYLFYLAELEAPTQ